MLGSISFLYIRTQRGECFSSLRKACVIPMVSVQNLQNTIIVGNHVVKRLDNVRTLLVDDKVLKFTPTEYSILLHLLVGNPVSDKELILSIFNSKVENDFWAREALDRHLDNIRRKLRKSQLEIYIRRIATFGYILLPDVPLRKR